MERSTLNETHVIGSLCSEHSLVIFQSFLSEAVSDLTSAVVAPSESNGHNKSPGGHRTPQNSEATQLQIRDRQRFLPRMVQIVFSSASVHMRVL